MGAAYEGWKKQFLGGGKRHFGYNAATEEKAQEKELKQLRRGKYFKKEGR